MQHFSFYLNLCEASFSLEAGVCPKQLFKNIIKSPV